MAVKVMRMIPMLKKVGISFEYLVMYPSRKPAANVNGIVLKNILKLFLKPILNEFILEKVLGKRILAPRIKPAPASITIAKISIDP